MTQPAALNLLKTGRNVFVTGPAGSGKTHVVNEYIRYLRAHDVSIGVTASTGIAATHMGGVTIHSWAGMGVKSDLTEYDLETLAENARLVKRFKETAVLIIDEVSMLHHFHLDMVDAISRRLRARPDEPFGGLQIVLCGDFFQLPPVSKFGAEAQFIYRSGSWKDGRFTVCYLSENYRQKSDPAASILNEIRSGSVSEQARSELKSRHGRRTVGRPGSPSSGIEPTRLYTHNVDVDAVNEAELDKIDVPVAGYEMHSKGRKLLVEALKRSCLAPELLRLKKGARIMCVKNNFDAGYVNGTLGTVVSCGFGVDPVIQTAPTPEWPHGRILTIERATWVIEDGDRVVAEISQYPLRLAWAITVHKSQGMSLDAVEVDLSKSFEPGMGYVALSRVRSLNGLTILGMNEAALRVHPEVLEYDRHLRELSDKAEAVLSGVDESALVRAQEEFLAKVAPLHRIARTKGRRPRAPKESTYDHTAKLIKKKKSLRDIAAERDVAVETVIAHIEELVKVGPEQGGLTPKDIRYLAYEISPQRLPTIERALEEVAESQNDGKPPLLSPVKNKVGPNISFKDIRLARVLLGYISGPPKTS